MKKYIAVVLFALAAVQTQAQKFALLDMEYILKNIPAYEYPFYHFGAAIHSYIRRNFSTKKLPRKSRYINRLLAKN